MIRIQNIIRLLAAVVLVVSCCSVELYAQQDTVECNVDFSRYDFIRMDANHIEFNGSDWSNFIDALADTDNRRVNIVHIGDSHIQADIATAAVRNRLQEVFGSAGRGLLVPHRMTGSNEALDYSFKTRSNFDASRLVGKGLKNNVGFTGVGLSSKSDKFDIEISAHEPFERVRVFFDGSELSLSSAECDGEPLVVLSTADTTGSLIIDLPFACDKVGLNFYSTSPVTIYGAEIMSDIVGVAYHTIGINGATFASYMQVHDFGERVASLSPDLIVVSLGTNDSLGRFSSDELLDNLSSLCGELKNYNPQTPILLLTPSEIQRRNRRKGKKRGSFAVCSNIEKVGDLIKNYGRQNAVAVYDWYTVSGGYGSSTKWLGQGLLGKDRVHDTRTGYILAGELFSRALLDAASSAVVASNMVEDLEIE